MLCCHSCICLHKSLLVIASTCCGLTLSMPSNILFWLWIRFHLLAHKARCSENWPGVSSNPRKGRKGKRSPPPVSEYFPWHWGLPCIWECANVLIHAPRNSHRGSSQKGPNSVGLMSGIFIFPTLLFATVASWSWYVPYGCSGNSQVSNSSPIQTLLTKIQSGFQEDHTESILWTLLRPNLSMDTLTSPRTREASTRSQGVKDGPRSLIQVHKVDNSGRE